VNANDDGLGSVIPLIGKLSCAREMYRVNKKNKSKTIRFIELNFFMTSEFTIILKTAKCKKR
jgi:hypothetical protein